MDSPARQEVERAIAEYRATRDVLETSVLPLATSVDGLTLPLPGVAAWTSSCSRAPT